LDCDGKFPTSWNGLNDDVGFLDSAIEKLLAGAFD
jgi:hypothetical protein